MPETKTYRIVYEETIVYVFYAEGTSKEDAIKNFTEAGYNGEIDFSDGEVSDTRIKSIEEDTCTTTS